MSSSRSGSAAMANSSTKDDDVLMSKEHKQILREYRDILVENMYPDDILNQLQSQKVLTTRDSARIKERTSAEAMNESLLDALGRKPDRAFAEFINALRESDQNHVANIIDKNKESTPKERRDQRKSRAKAEELDEEEELFASPTTSRKRKHGEVGVRLKVDKLEFDEDEEEVVDEEERGPQSKRSAAAYISHLNQEEEKIKKRLDIKLLKVISKEVDNLDRVVSNGLTQSSMGMRRAALETIRELQKYRREIMGVDFGSVVFRIVCHSVAGLEDLRLLCDSGKLSALAEKILTTETLKQYSIKRVKIDVSMDPEEFSHCMKDLESKRTDAPENTENLDPQLVLRSNGKSISWDSGIALEPFSSWPALSEDLDLVKYLSLRSPPHTPSSPDNHHFLCRQSAQESLTPEQIQLLASRSPRSRTEHEPRGRSPIRRRKARPIKDRLKIHKKSLSLSPLPINRQTVVDLHQSSIDTAPT